ncbi:DUF1127 domain-containing protein [Arenibaculum pallidiluteum]|uniref:hypothetical protein n=1 Tax=Arenibaculum pallidiluteum TaxID=2812559 RepID=UPI001A979D69|nr:hypothetical protein [Arenibaculum pallidiluteum]
MYEMHFLTTPERTGPRRGTGNLRPRRDGNGGGVVLVSEALRALWCRLMEYRRQRLDHECLLRLSDHHLRDVGLRRVELEGTVRFVQVER